MKVVVELQLPEELKKLLNKLSEDIEVKLTAPKPAKED